MVRKQLITREERWYNYTSSDVWIYIYMPIKHEFYDVNEIYNGNEKLYKCWLFFPNISM